VLLNFKAKSSSSKIDLDLSKAKLLVDNYPTPSKGAELKPYEAAVYEW
jgi:oligo-1,6-glucosidase